MSYANSRNGGQEESRYFDHKSVLVSTISASDGSLSAWTVLEIWESQEAAVSPSLHQGILPMLTYVLYDSIMNTC